MFSSTDIPVSSGPDGLMTFRLRAVFSLSNALLNVGFTSDQGTSVHMRRLYCTGLPWEMKLDALSRERLALNLEPEYSRELEWIAFTYSEVHRTLQIFR